ncbi:MAG: hypothetical protein H7263_15670 [Candidatus Sericytochromatia bacterium]|nr:hypothetical protein [Candidatus Sericytochromatia bacterium]
MVGQSAKSVSKDLSAGSNFKERLSGIIHNMPQVGAKLPTTLLRNLYNVPVKPEGWATWGKRLAGEVPKFLGF